MQKTSLYDEHVAEGARMVDFAGWMMPVQYEGVVAEHLAVREAAGRFDVSHMGQVLVQGPGAKDFLQRMITNNLDKIYPGKAIYSAMCNPQGGVVDDLIVYQEGLDAYFVVVNAGTRPKDVAWLEKNAPAGVQVTDVSDHYALIALQGPKSEDFLQPLTASDLTLLKFFHFVDGQVAGIAARIGRTGYTGEDGFEIFVPWNEGPKLWRALAKAKACGLGARDSLRLEAGLMLYGNDLTDDITPLEAPLSWVVDLSKEFIGKEALVKPPIRKLFGFELSRGVSRHGDRVTIGGQEAGVVTSGGFSPLLKKAIGYCLLPKEAPSEVDVIVHGKPVQAHLRDTRFYVRPKKGH